MNRLSIKTRVTLWYVVFMLLIVGLVFTFVLSISGSLIHSSTQSRLKSMVEESFKEIDFDDGELEIDDDLEFFQNGIYLSIYNENDELIYGRTPSGFTENMPLSSDKLQTIESGKNQWYSYDLQMPVKDHGNVWVRGVVSLSDTEESMKTMINLALIALPFIIIIAAGGGYYITKKAFRPVSRITEAAEKIGSGNDLSQRINLGDGKDEIYSLAATFDHMFDRLQRSFEVEKQFTSDASHELRTPTAVIVSQSEYALENAKSLDEAKETLQVVLSQARKMSGLISQLLTLARTDKGNQKLDMELVNLSEIAEMVVEEQRVFAEDKNIEIQTQIETDILLRADQTMMMRLFINLLTNAITYGRDSGHVFVSLERKADSVHCMIQDDGVGIAAEHLAKIWDRFYQVDPSRTSDKEGGMGLGLSMVKWIVEAHGGTVFAKSKLGEGSSFYFTLPIKKDSS